MLNAMYVVSEGGVAHVEWRHAPLQAEKHDISTARLVPDHSSIDLLLVQISRAMI
jgi:hypothetical protein